MNRVFQLKWLFFFTTLFFGYSPGICQNASQHDLHFNMLPVRWDEGIPLGNGMLGALIWQKDSSLRIALDRADLWDLRPVREFALPQFSFTWVKEQLENGTYDSVQKFFDEPYERDAGPTKIPAGALEIPVGGMGEVESVHLYLSDALCEVKWKSGARFIVFVDANRNRGWFHLENFPLPVALKLDAPDFTLQAQKGTSNSVDGQSLGRLNYTLPVINGSTTGFLYTRQQGYGNFHFAVIVEWKEISGNVVEGSWRIETSHAKEFSDLSFESLRHDSAHMSFDSAILGHRRWWKEYWEQSSIKLPDSLLENQWYRDIYKFGSASRKGAPPITLQAVWTADNGKLPPWKGDFHNDLNTQLSYWPGYSSNHLEESRVFCDWIWRNRGNAENYTKNYFNCEGLNFPGVSTLSGEPMGGWIQYALSPTISCWLAQHFYNQWKYSGDLDFLVQEAYPFISNAAIFIENLSIKKGKFRQLPLSSSPEFNDNSSQAWFSQTTNYDLALIRWLYRTAAELATDLGKTDDLIRWERCLNNWPDLALSDSGSLLIAPGYPYRVSHRHFSHLMSIYPLGIYDWNSGRFDREIISASIRELLRTGPDNWCGYSYAWLGNLQARAFNGEGAAEALRTFAGCFCLSNSFHANGDQSGTGKSTFTYRPFTLEGNFAFASGIQEMLMQSNHDLIVVFPAIPEKWKEVSFQNLRAQGAFLVSATRKDGKIQEVKIFCEKGGELHLKNPFGKERVRVNGARRVRFGLNGVFTIKTKPGQTIVFQ
ncbi:MAG: glycoside hydrolase family 95-like protein [Bacteroidota bacterium]